MRSLPLILALFLLTGCVETLSPATKAAIAQVKSDAAVAAAKADAATKAAEAAAKAKPTSHPLEFSNLVVQDIRGPLVLVGTICTFLFFGGVGLWIAAKFVTALGGILTTVASLLAPIAGTIAAGCWVSLWLAPLFFWVVSATVVGAVVIFVVQLAKAHWSIVDLLHLHNQNAKAIESVANGTPAVVTVKQ